MSYTGTILTYDCRPSGPRAYGASSSACVFILSSDVAVYVAKIRIVDA